ncbi:hypothetical protein [Demequina sp.]|uniref:hypothetical protein n=1 Tax=Demequina sp. TaxID=2050685 RepID=UPI0025FE0DC5|nr:hypothetical protein [Demequina sp.]
MSSIRTSATRAALAAAAVAAWCVALASLPAAAAPVPAAPIGMADLADVVPAIAVAADAPFDFDTPKVSIEEPEPEPAAAPATGGGYSFGVNLAGHQAALDLCAGWVWEDFGSYGRVVSSHNHCGGDVVLGMQVGDTVRLSGHGAGTYVVTKTLRVSKGASATVLAGGLWMQTCYYDDATMRLVRLARA